MIPVKKGRCPADYIVLRLRIAMLVTICTLTTLGLAWSWFSEIDIHATARGKVKPAGHAKVVQPLEAGTVAEVRVVDGQAVHAGNVLVVLDRREADAELATATAVPTAAEAEALRRGAELDAVRNGLEGEAAMPTWPSEVSAATRARKEAVLRCDLAELRATLASLGAQAREKDAAVQQLGMSMDAERQLMGRKAERVQLREALVKEGNGSKLTLIDAEQSLLETRGQLVGDTGRKVQAEAAVISLEAERRKTLEAFLADDARKQADAARLADEKRQERAQVLARLDQLTLRAQVDGTVNALAITNVGQVVTPSQEVMRIVPAGMPLEVLAYVTNDDAGFVQPGQRAVVKVDAFPYTRFGTLEAEVLEVAADAIPGSAANQAQGDATRPAGHEGSAALTASPIAQPVSDLVFTTRLKPLEQGIKVSGRTVPLSPGMTVTVEVKTGQRRVLEHLFSPLVDMVSKAGRGNCSPHSSVARLI